jgi:hypothetical protein
MCWIVYADSTPSILVLRAHLKNYAIPKFPYLLGILAFNLLYLLGMIPLLPQFLLPSHKLLALMTSYYGIVIDV